MESKLVLIKEGETIIGFAAFVVDDIGNTASIGSVDEPIEIIETDKEHLQNALDQMPEEYLSTITQNSSYTRGAQIRLLRGE